MNNAISITAPNGMNVTLSNKTDARIVSASRRGADRMVVVCADRAAATALTGELKAWGFRLGAPLGTIVMFNG